MARELQGMSEADLKAMLSIAQKELAQGRELTSTSAGDASASFNRASTVRQRIFEIKYELWELDSEKYSKPTRHSRTKPVIYSS